MGDKVLFEGTMQFDPAQKPKAFNTTGSTPDGKVKTQYGIYEINGDILRMCVDESGSARPTSFVTKPGSQEKLTVFKRKN